MKGSRAHSIIISQLNCCSVLGKFSLLESIVSETHSDIMFFSETWLQPNSIDENFLVIPSFSMHRRDRCSGGRRGGLLVYVKSCLSVCTNRRIDLEDESMECITLELFSPAPKHLLVFCYRPPNQSPELFFNMISPVYFLKRRRNIL